MYVYYQPPIELKGILADMASDAESTHRELNRIQRASSPFCTIAEGRIRGEQ
jgi:hypothetical protein